MKTAPTFKEATKFWFKLGFISFGGPAGQIAIMHEYLVDKKKWISDSRFMHALNYCMLLPGPEAQQLATYIGWLLHGTWGGLVAGALFVLPSVFILLGLSIVYVTFGSVPWIYAMFVGLKPSVIAIIILALIKIGKKSLISFLHYIIAALAFILIFFFHISFPLIIVGAILIAVVINFLFPNFSNSSKNESEKKKLEEAEFYINNNTLIQGAGFYPLKFTKQILMGLVLWIIPFLIFNLYTNDFEFWNRLSFFFTQAAFVTFGGAYAVLPYVAQVSVEEFHWLSNLQMMDGLALGETTPGPLIMVLSFVGFMAGYHQFDNSIVMGSLGLLMTTFYTFLPCFIFIFAGAPIIEKTQDNKTVKSLLAIVTAAVVGVVLNLAVYLGKTVLISFESNSLIIHYSALLWMLISFIALYKFKINMIVWIGVSALYGLLIHFLM